MGRIPTLRLIVNDDYDNVGREFHRTVSQWRELASSALQYAVGGLSFITLVWAISIIFLSLGR